MDNGESNKYDEYNEIHTPFWIEAPCVLIDDFNLIPNAGLTLNEKLNALTRVILLVTGSMYIMEYKYWFTFLIVGLAIVFIIKILDKKNMREGFSIPPTYVDGAEPVTTIPPIHAEEWQSPPPIYDEYTNVPSPEGKCGEYREDRPIFGQYISSHRLFPYQGNELANKPLNDAQLYMNDEFTRDTLQHRNDMVRGFVNRIDREYRHGCYDQISPWNSY